MKEQQELLDLKKIIAAIRPQNRRYLKKLFFFESIDSTNSYLLAQLKSQREVEQSGWVCLAEQQTMGRGRQGKEWFSPPGMNIYCSLSWCFSAAFNGLSALSMAIAAMMIKALESVGLQQRIDLKWPNDLLISGRKLAGILLENSVSLQQNKIVIGIGLNRYLPAENRESWIGLGEVLEKMISRNELIGILLDELFTGISLFETQGLQPFLLLCREHDILLGKEVEVSTPSSRYSGLACGISDQGELRVLGKQKQEYCLSYGEVSAQLVESKFGS